MPTATGLDLKHMSIHAIARVIQQDWQKVNFAAAPYLQAMYAIDTIGDTYGLDPARDIVVRFLGNAGSWRGDVAREVKGELRRRMA